MSEEPGHSEVVNILLDLQARLRGDSPERAPASGATMVDARPPAMPAAGVDTVSVTEGEVEIITGSSPRVEAPDLETPAPPVPESAGSWWNPAVSVAVPAPPVISPQAVSDVPATPVLQVPELETPPSPPVPATREEQIAELAERIDRLEQELAFLAEELWRLAGDPTPAD